MATSPLFFGKLPTDPEVRLLMVAFPDLRAGQLISHREIEEVIDRKWKTSRYHTIVNAWRSKLLREKNIDTEAVSGVGIKILEEKERVQASVGWFRQGVRKIGRSVRRIGLVKTETLSEDDQRRTEHSRRVMEGTALAAKQAAKEISIVSGLKPVERLPKWRPDGK